MNKEVAGFIVFFCFFLPAEVGLNGAVKTAI